MIVVVFGGSGFMGRLLVSRLCSPAASWCIDAGFVVTHVFVCNRGHTLREGQDTLDCHEREGDVGRTSTVTVRHVTIDWDDAPTRLQESLCALAALLTNVLTELPNIQQSDKRRLSFVNFSCTEPRPMRVLTVCVLQPLLEHTASCVWISTDSVYLGVLPAGETTCGVSESGTLVQVDPQVTEISGCCPAAAAAETCCDSVSSVSSSDSSEDLSYGEEKRAVECIVEKYIAPNVPCCVTLRLPDVIGPFDRTGRFWATMLWALAAAADHRSAWTLKLPASAARCKMSVAYAPDVVHLVLRLIASGAQVLPSSGPAAATGHDVDARTFNVACFEAPTVEEFCASVWHETLRQAAGWQPLMQCFLRTPPSPHLTVAYVAEDADTADYYPSVDCGPLDFTAAKQSLDWSPTPLHSAVSDAVAFFLKITSCFLSREKNASQPQCRSAELTRALEKLPSTIRKRVERTFSMLKH